MCIGANWRGRIYQRLVVKGAPVDIIVAGNDDLERYEDSHALIIKPALRKGSVANEAA